MKTTCITGCIVLCVLLVSASGTLEGQNKRTGTAAATELLIPIGARDLALSGAAMAISNGTEAIHFNPAGLSRMQYSAEGMMSTMSYLGDINVNFGAVAMNFKGFGALGFSVKSLNFGDVPLTTVDDPDNQFGRTFSPTFLTIGLTYSRALTDAVAAGMNLKLVMERIDRVSSSGFAVDLGVQYNRLLGLKGFSLGVAVKNIGPGMQFDGPGLYRDALPIEGLRPAQKLKSEAATFELPSTVEIGLAYTAPMADNLNGTICGSFTNNNLFLDEYRLGGEIGYAIEKVQLFARVGANMLPQAETDGNIFGPTYGAGLSYAATGIDITIDYAYRTVKFFEANQVMCLRVGF